MAMPANPNLPTLAISYPSTAKINCVLYGDNEKKF
jgi:hypothetical protein